MLEGTRPNINEWLRPQVHIKMQLQCLYRPKPCELNPTAPGQIRLRRTQMQVRIQHNNNYNNR